MKWYTSATHRNTPPNSLSLCTTNFLVGGLSKTHTPIHEPQDFIKSQSQHVLLVSPNENCYFDETNLEYYRYTWSFNRGITNFSTTHTHCKIIIILHNLHTITKPNFIYCRLGEFCNLHHQQIINTLNHLRLNSSPQKFLTWTVFSLKISHSTVQYWHNYTHIPQYCWWS